MRTSFIFLLLILLFFNSCRLINYKDTSVEVYVENVSLHEPLVGHPVKLKEISSNFSGTTVKLIATQLTDSDGMVYFDFEGHKNYDYEVEFDYQGGEEGFASINLDDQNPNGTFDRIDIEAGKHQNVNMRIVRGGRLRLIIENRSNNFENEVMIVN